MFDKDEFADVAEHLLNTIVNVYTENATSLPERRYLTVGSQGETVHDCEQVTVSFEQGYSGMPGNQAQEPAKCDEPRSGVYIVEVVRCLPLPNTAASASETAIPARYGQTTTGVSLLSPEDQTTMAKVQMVDAMLLLEAGLRAGETNFTGSLVDVSAGSPQGGYQAMIMTLTCSAISALV